MLSIFPELLPYSFIGIAIVRITIGLVLFYIGLMTLGVKKTSYENEMKMKDFPFSKVVPLSFGIAEITIGLFLIVGFLTQLMILLAVYIFLNLIFIEKFVGRVFDYPNIFYIALILMSISILFLGPGAYSVDLPI